MANLKLKKILLGLGIIPILAGSTLVLASCFNTQQQQFSPKKIGLNNDNGITGVTPEVVDGVQQVPSLEFSNNAYSLENVYTLPKWEEEVPDFPATNPFENEYWSNQSKFASTQILNSILIGTGTNIDGAYTIGQLLRAILFNQSMAQFDAEISASNEQTWTNFLVLIANNLNQSSGTFVDSADQYLFELSNIDITSVSATTPFGQSGIPYAGTLSSLNNDALLADYYNTSIDLTINGFSFEWFDFNGNPKEAPSINSSQANTLKKQGYEGEGIEQGYDVKFKTPLKITYVQYPYLNATENEDGEKEPVDTNEKFPDPLTGTLPTIETEEGNTTFENVGIFKGLKFNDINITNSLNLDMTNGVNQTQRLLNESKTDQAANEFKIAVDNMFGQGIYNIESPITSLISDPIPFPKQEPGKQ